ncbi:hypothetical protein A3709_19850 [Halioglobus sp. HI00S01]|uniref:DNA-binding protein n=1 Tax=Halioglobus sp. HI00S01 TaxID=1822214 RepID=UPI0007C3C122|nr:DNA-binding protein [Halioglobus sp. HI00S01]KZX57879.1 hypothetical protein A3709_19850 [Halioglobus sp. HI00S01]
MPRRELATFLKVDKVARKLVSEGKTPTARLVHAALGEGSLTTITKHLETWQSQSGITKESGLDALPAPAQEALLGGLVAAVDLIKDRYADVAHGMVDRAEQQLEVAETQLAETVAASETAAQAAAAEIASLSAELADCREIIKCKTDELKAAQDALQAANESLAATEAESHERGQALEEARQVAREATREKARLYDQLIELGPTIRKEFQSQLDTRDERIDQLNIDLRQSAEEVSNAKGELAVTRLALEDSERRLGALQDDKHRLESAETVARTALKKAQEARQAEITTVRDEGVQARKLLEDQLAAGAAREKEQRKTIAELSRALGQQRRKQDGQGDSDSHPHSGAEAEE